MVAMTATATSVIRIVLVDDHQLMLDSLAARINAEPDFSVVGFATNADDGLKMILETKPDIALLDIQLPGRGTFDIANELASRQKETNVVFLSGHVIDIFITEVLRSKARGYLVKEEPFANVISSLRRVSRGDTCYSSKIEDRISYDPEKKRHVVESESRLAKLTSRQLEVLRYLALGFSVKEVAREMHLSEKSVDSHKYRIMHKLDIHDRVELARFSIREGLILP